MIQYLALPIIKLSRFHMIDINLLGIKQKKSIVIILTIPYYHIIITNIQYDEFLNHARFRTVNY